MDPIKYHYIVTLDSGGKYETDSLSDALRWYKYNTNLHYTVSEYTGYRYFNLGVCNNSEDLEVLKHIERQVKKHITCCNCGKHIYYGDKLFYVPGMKYRCCSSDCLLGLIQTVAEVKLDEDIVEKLDLNVF